MKKKCFHFSFDVTIAMASALLKTIASYPEQVTNLSLYDTEEEFTDPADDGRAADAAADPRPFC